jgi:hypothetical protein
MINLVHGGDYKFVVDRFNYEASWWVFLWSLNKIEFWCFLVLPFHWSNLGKCRGFRNGFFCKTR